MDNTAISISMRIMLSQPHDKRTSTYHPSSTTTSVLDHHLRVPGVAQG